MRALVLACALLAAATLASAQTRALIALTSDAPVQGPATLYLAPGTGVDAVETAVTIPVKALASLTNLSCRLSGSAGSATVTLTARTGTCGTVSDTSFVCTIGASAQACDTGVAFLSVAPGQCLVWRLTISAALPAPRYLTCSLERSA